MAQKNLIGENGGERKINPSANPVCVCPGTPVVAGNPDRDARIRLALNCGLDQDNPVPI